MTETRDCGMVAIAACGIIAFLKHGAVSALKFLFVQLYKGNTKDLLNCCELQF